MLGNVESTIYAFSTNKWPQMWPQEQIEWATGNLLLDSRDRLRERSGSYQSVAEVDPKPPCLLLAPQSITSVACQERLAFIISSISSTDPVCQTGPLET
jgi:hypothetical protein